MIKNSLFKKVSISLATLTLICPLALSGLDNPNVNAKRRHVRTHKVYRHRKARKRARRSRSHESSATWYAHNLQKLYRRYRYSRVFKIGLQDGSNTPMSYDTLANSIVEMQGLHYKTYKYGWLYSYLEFRYGGGADDGKDTFHNGHEGRYYYGHGTRSPRHVARALKTWNNAMSYHKAHPSYKALEHIGDGTNGWEKAD